MMKPLEQLVRPNILNLVSHVCERNEYTGRRTARIFLNANENPFNAPLNRFPDPLQNEVKARIAKLKGISPRNIFLGHRNDETIDLIFRIFCMPQVDNVVAIEPTNNIYKVCADINDVEYRKVLLDENFQISADALLAVCDEKTKIVWICSPNNPTGNNLDREEIRKFLVTFGGIVVIDETYNDFSKHTPFSSVAAAYPNLVTLYAMDAAWGCAGICIGMAFAHNDIISLFNKVKHPYNIDSLAQKEALDYLKDPFAIEKWVKLILQERDSVMEAFRELRICEKVYPSDANFFLVKMKDARSVYNYLVSKGIMVCNWSDTPLCDNCLRVTIGTKTENSGLLAALRQY